jgi:DNA-binding NarL/FixJ family response regulator
MKRAAPKAAAKARIAVVDDHPMLREGVVQLINRQEDVVVCGEGDSIASARAVVEEKKPDLLLLDLRLGGGDTLELIKSFKAQYPALPILVFSQFEETMFAEKSMRAGARGYVMKQEATEEVLAAIRALLKGEMYISRQIAVLVLQKSFDSPIQAASENDVTVEKLSDRELHVFQMIGADFSTRQIAEELRLSVKTIETHRENVKRKLNLATGRDLVSRAKDWVKANFHPDSGTDLLSVWER